MSGSERISLATATARESCTESSCIGMCGWVQHELGAVIIKNAIKSRLMTYTRIIYGTCKYINMEAAC